ncbi:MAG: tetratricopeptide repeat protein [candidate division WS1 bacterium]|jgi:hypothetical protein|nr:tetratricopeptide repeat protein [candidate division WS1 bacterium]
MGRKPVVHVLVLCLIAAVMAVAPAGAASIERGRELVAQGRMAEAVTELQEVVTAAPDQLAAHFWLGRAHFGLGDLEGAASAFETVLTAKATSHESRYWLAEVRRLQGRLSEAAGLFEQVLAADAGHAQAHASLTAVQDELARREQLLAPAAVDWVLPTENRYVGLEIGGIPVTPGDTAIYSDHVYDYTFSDPPTDWIMAGGLWETTSRWTCSPQWSWLGGFEPNGIAAFWNKRQFLGDITVELYAAFKMGVTEGVRSYRNPNDMNITICGDGANPSSGYSFIYGGELNSSTRIMKGTRVLTENRDPEALLPIFEDAYPSTYDFHRKWWMVKVRKSGDTLSFWVDNKLVAETRDDEPLDGGRVGIWARDNGLILSRIKIYYEREQIPRDPVPMTHLAVRRTEQVHPRQATLTSASHPAIFNDFSTDLGGVSGRDGDQGAMVTIAAPGADGAGHCAKLINTYAGGTFAANLHGGRLDLRQLPRLSFDYRLDPNARVNVHLTVDGEPCEIVFSGPAEASAGRQLIGRIAGVKADGQWHHAQFDLLGHAQQAFGAEAKLIASDLFIGNMSSKDYLDAGFGGNIAGTTVLLDNLGLHKPAPGTITVAAAAAKGVTATGWAIGLGSDGSRPAPAEANSEDGTATLEPTRDGAWYVHATPRLEDGSWGEAETLLVLHDSTGPSVIGVTPAGNALADGGPVRIKVSDGGGIGVNPASIKVAVGERELGIDGRNVRFDPGSEEVVVDVAALGMSFPSGGTLPVELLAAADRNGASMAGGERRWAFRVGPEVVQSAPPAPVITVGDIAPLVDDFEHDTGEWSNWGAEGGAVVSLDPTTAASGKSSLRLVNPTTGGSFGAYIRKTAFDAGRYRVVRFAYKVPERLRADIMLHVNGARKSIRFTDTDSSYQRIGEVPDVVADNTWRYAEFDLYQMLRADDPQAPGYNVLQMWIADSGWTSNAPGQMYNIDDFSLIPIVSAAQPVRMAWQLHDIAGLGGVNWAIDKNPWTQLPQQVVARSSEIDWSESGDVDGWLHVRAANSAGKWSETAHRRLLIDSSQPTAAQVSPAAGAQTATSSLVLDLKDSGIAGVDPGSVVLNVGGEDYSVSNNGLTYLSDQGRLVWNCENTSPQPTVFADGQQIEVTLKRAADYAGNPVTELPSWSWTMDYSKDKTPPVIAEIDCSTHRSFLTQTFEDGVDGWATRGGAEGALVEHDTTTAASGSGSVKLTQQRDDGHMQALLTPRTFQADQFPVIAFDYRFDSGTKLDLLLHMNGQWWPVAMTDDPSGSIGRIPGMRADGKWHHASVNVAPLLKRHQRQGALNVTAIMVGDRNSRDNKVGTTAHFDNVIIGSVGTVKPVFRWKATDTTGIAGYSYVLDQEPATEPPAESMGATAAKSFDALTTGLWFMHVRAVDGAGNWGKPSHYAIMHSAG